MRRIVILAMSAALLTAACGSGETGDATTTSTLTTTSSAPDATTAPAVTMPSVPPSPTTTTPESPDVRAVEALAWGLLCSDLVAAGWEYAGAVAYWNAEGRPVRMDADENGIPCETVYPTNDVVAHWGDPLPSELSPGPGSGWRPSRQNAPVAAACCSMNNNGPVSPPLPPESGPFPDDGAYSVVVHRQKGQTDRLELEIRRWLPCAEQPDRCSPDLYPGDVYADPDGSVVRSIELDDELLVVVRPIACLGDGTWEEAPIEGDGAALASLLRRIDAAVTTVIAPAYGAADLEIAGATDPTFPYGPVPCEDLGWVIGYRGPENTYLTDGWYAVFEWDQPSWMYGWWCSLEIVDSKPVLYIWAGQIAG